MKSMTGVMSLLGLAGAALVWSQVAGHEPPRAPQRAGERDTENPAATLEAAAAQRRPSPAAPETPAVATGAPISAAAERTPPGPSAAETAAEAIWPVAHTTRRAPASTGSVDSTPAVTPEIAFMALRYVGADREAEKTWQRAINDPAMPPDVRSDLIEDLNENGFTDNGHPTAADLPLIEARLTLIERLAPYAIDEVNAAAFEEAYKDLLQMYVRLGGKARPPSSLKGTGK